jgi:hypothetical protein
VNRTRHFVKTFALSALVGLTLTACGDGEYAEACMKTGNHSEEDCACMQKVGEAVVEKDEKAKDLVLAVAAADKAALGAAAEAYGKMESLGVLIAIGTGMQQQCNIQ